MIHPDPEIEAWRQRTLSYLKKAFGMAKVDCTVLDRGTEFPKQLDAAAQLVRAERRRITRPAARA